MNIAILHYSVPPIVGGVESVVAHHARLMSADGHSVRLIAARGESLSAQIPLTVISLADSQHERVGKMKAQLDRGEATRISSRCTMIWWTNCKLLYRAWIF